MCFGRAVRGKPQHRHFYGLSRYIAELRAALYLFTVKFDKDINPFNPGFISPDGLALTVLIPMTLPSKSATFPPKGLHGHSSL
jgi:hypothetical protein